MTDAGGASPMIFDVISNPEEDRVFDFMRAEAMHLNSQCKVAYLRDTMRCLLEQYLDCKVGDPKACENGSFPGVQGARGTEALDRCRIPPQDCS